MTKTRVHVRRRRRSSTAATINFYRYESGLHELFNGVKTVKDLRSVFRRFVESDEVWDAIEAGYQHVKEDDAIQAQFRDAVTRVAKQKRVNRSI